MPLLLTAVEAGKLTVQQYSRATSEGPARAFGLGPRKGALAVGYDADMTIVRTGAPGVIAADQLHSRARATPFDGVPVTASVTHTIVRGTVVAKAGRVVGSAVGRDVRVA